MKANNEREFFINKKKEMFSCLSVEELHQWMVSNLFFFENNPNSGLSKGKYKIKNFNLMNFKVDFGDISQKENKFKINGDIKIDFTKSNSCGGLITNIFDYTGINICNKNILSSENIFNFDLLADDFKNIFFNLAIKQLMTPNFIFAINNVVKKIYENNYYENNKDIFMNFCENNSKYINNDLLIHIRKKMLQEKIQKIEKENTKENKNKI